VRIRINDRTTHTEARNMLDELDAHITMFTVSPQLTEAFAGTRVWGLERHGSRGRLGTPRQVVRGRGISAHVVEFRLASALEVAACPYFQFAVGLTLTVTFSKNRAFWVSI
jgi:hypothetical protein